MPSARGIIDATMKEGPQVRFNAGARAWAEYNQAPLGRIRHEVTWQNLVPHLPDITNPDDPPRVLDAGGGSGELALELVQRGYCVWLLDSASAMLDQARHAAQSLPRPIYERLCFCEMAIDQAPQAFTPGFFDVVACHTLVEYLPDPQATFRSLASLLRDGGLLSVSFVNRHAQVLREIWSRVDPVGALTKLESGSFRANLFEIEGVAFDAEQVGDWLAELGLDVVSACGVRVFADYVPPERLNDVEFFDALLRLELAAAARSPYRLIGRYVHLLAHKNVELS